jgi:G6PDH family F420-dependent oxidoreductase
MAEIGFFLSSEEHGPSELTQYARQGAEAGFRSVFISDHYHPWTERQGESPFVWSVIGAIAATTELNITTGVTCPTVRVHPAVVAQAAATSALMASGRFRLGVGSGEALNEHILGDRWPSADVRLEMLEEAVEVMRELWKGGFYSHRGRHYTVENAKIYSRPDQPPPVYVSGFGPKAIELAGRIGDGFVTTAPNADDIGAYRKAGGKGPTLAALKVCWGPDQAAAEKLAYDLWPTTGVPGELSQELPMPAHFEQAAQTVTPEMVTAKIACGPDPARFVSAFEQYLEAGFDQIYVSQIGEDQAGFLDFYFSEVQPRLSL